VRSTLIGAVITVVLALVGAAVWGMYGTVLLAGVGTLISAAISWHFFVKAMQESGRVPVPRWMAVSMGGRRAAEPPEQQAAGRHRRAAAIVSRTPLAPPTASAIQDSREPLLRQPLGAAAPPQSE
jgi:hypothetical protein